MRRMLLRWRGYFWVGGLKWTINLINQIWYSATKNAVMAGHGLGHHNIPSLSADKANWCWKNPRSTWIKFWRKSWQVSKDLFKDIRWNFAAKFSNLRSFLISRVNYEMMWQVPRVIFVSREPLHEKFMLHQWRKEFIWELDVVISPQHTLILPLTIMKIRCFKHFLRASIRCVLWVSLLVRAIRLHIVPWLNLTSQFIILLNIGFETRQD